MKFSSRVDYNEFKYKLVIILDNKEYRAKDGYFENNVFVATDVMDLFTMKNGMCTVYPECRFVGTFVVFSTETK